MAWVLVLNLLLYGLYGLASGHFRRDLLPQRAELEPRRLLADLRQHLRLHRARGESARRYNPLQKLSYLTVVFLLFPLQLLSGLTMANGVTAAFPWLFDLFGGRQSARTIHFLCAMALLAFLLIHVFQVFVAGFRNEMRSMITGRFRLEKESPP
jgi:thiosulfate reductase cytochrome b subunit